MSLQGAMERACTASQEEDILLKSRDRNPTSRRRFMIAGGLFAASTIATPATTSASKLLSRPPAYDLMARRITYFPETGHHVSGEYLTQWGRMGGLSTLGPPISEPTLLPSAEYQAFRNGVLYRLADTVLGAALGNVNALPVGLMLAAQYPGARDADRGDASSSFWFSKTSFGTHPLLWQVFLDGGGAFVFGYPISNLVWQYGSRVQWFQKARLNVNEDGKVSISPLGKLAAGELGIETRRVPRRPDASLFYGIANPMPTGRVEDRRIEIDLARQRLAAFQGETRVYDLPVSTGRRATPTPTGTFPIIRRVENERMIGGEPGTASYYDLSNIYFTQYFTSIGHALHYAYWHDNFGNEMSHGCVNMTLWDSKWIWNFAASGVPITTLYSE